MRRLRERLGTTRHQFATAFALPVGTVRGWEQGRERPDALARALLRVSEREPETARQAMAPADAVA